ncbi:MAG: hypothetical protein FWC70_04000 [Defluviitaleaceae bacterium]|nr:hypothetical protein [Defluviitaleaceae bacterium]
MEKLSPVKNYTPPQIPTLEAAREDENLLKKLPRRWKKLSLGAAAAFIGLASVTGCTGGGPGILSRLEVRMHGGGTAAEPFYIVYPTEDELRAQAEISVAAYRAILESTPLDVRTHTGGSGAGPFYIVYFTEQEAFGFIRAKLEEAGLRFGDEPPDYTIDASWVRPFTIDLHDAQNQVGVSFIGWQENNEPFFSHGGNSLSRNTAAEFNRMSDQLTTGVFYNPDASVLNGWWGSEWHNAVWETHGDESSDMWAWFEANRDHPEFGYAAFEAWVNEQLTNPERIESARQQLIENLSAQALEFIEKLQL